MTVTHSIPIWTRSRSHKDNTLSSTQVDWFSQQHRRVLMCFALGICDYNSNGCQLTYLQRIGWLVISVVTSFSCGQLLFFLISNSIIFLFHDQHFHGGASARRANQSSNWQDLLAKTPTHATLLTRWWYSVSCFFCSAFYVCFFINSLRSVCIEK